MNIAIFTDFFLPSLGGVQTSILNQKRALESAGHSVIIFAPCYDGHVAYQDKDGVIRLPSSRMIDIDGHRAFLPFPWRARRIEALLRQKNIHIIHIQTEFSVGLLGIKLGNNMGIPVVYTTHTLLWRQIRTKHKRPNVLTIVARLYFSAYLQTRLPLVSRLPSESWAELQWRRFVIALTCVTEATVSPSYHLAEKLNHPDNRGKISVIPNTTDFSHFPQKPLPQMPLLLWVGRFSPEKRPLELISALRHVALATKKPFRVIMCGRGDLQEECRHAAKDLSFIRFTSVDDYKNMPKIYDKASVVVVSSYGFENQPMIIAEALSRGRGVVYCDQDLTPDGLNDGAGILCDPTPEGMAVGILHVIENPDKLVMMSKRSVKAARRFSEQHYLATITKLYTSLIKV